MKISLNWLKKYTKINLSVDDLVDKIGLQLGAVEKVTDLRGKYQDIQVVQITEAKPHGNADRLNVYQITNGKEQVQVVSGDKTLDVGDKVAWLAPGLTVPSTFGTSNPVVLAPRDMRGVMSQGMFASGKELDFNDNETSVLRLDTEAKSGTLLAKAYELDDVIIDIENKMFTHRPDCFGLLGVAREIAGIQGKTFTSPAWYLLEKGKFFKPEADLLPLEIENEIPALCSVYTAASLRGITVGPSPLALQTYLKRVGIRPINNVVDATNYLMYLTGQPLHAFDYDKVAELDGHGTAGITVRLPKKGETIELLNGRTIEPHKSAIIIASRKKAIALGGIMGGTETEVCSDTKNIIIESANFDMYSIRRTSMEHGLFTDAVTRFSKGQSAQQTGVVLAEAVALVQTLAGGLVACEFGTQKPRSAPTVETSSRFINDRLGSRLRSSNIKALLESVEMQVSFKGDYLRITPPFWRTDIELAEDVVEEVGRLFGYSKLPHELPSRPAAAVQTQPIEKLKTLIGKTLAQAGNNELQTYSFISAKLLERTGQDVKPAYRLRNALSPELTYIRTSLLPSLLDKVHVNHKAGHSAFGLFEIGKSHNKHDIGEDKLPIEHLGLSYIFSAEPKSALQPEGAPFYQAKKQLTYLFSALKQHDIAYKLLKDDSLHGWRWQNVAAMFEPKRTAVVYISNQLVGIVGEFTQEINQNFKLPQFAAGFELDMQVINGIQQPGSTYQPLLKFPSIEQDICFKVEKKVTYQDLEQLIKKHFTDDQRVRTTVSPVDIYQRENDKNHKQITYRLTLQHHDRTLTTDEVTAAVKVIADKAKKEFDAVQV